MSNNRINNNDEVMLFMQLEPLVRVYVSLVPHDQARPDLEIKIATLLNEIDELRGYKFDTQAAAKEIFGHEIDYGNINPAH